MDESNLSRIVLKLRLAYPQYFKDMTKEETIGFVAMYKSQLSDFTYDQVNKAINSLISTHKYMPSVAEIIDECQMVDINYFIMILDMMYKDGYFHKSYKDNEKLSGDQAIRNYEKSVIWIKNGKIPSFLENDINEIEETSRISNTNINKLEK